MLYQCVFLIILFISLILIQSKYSILLDDPKGEQHKINYNKNVPLSGGIYLFLSFLLSTFLTKYHNENFLILLFIFFFLLLGIYSDIKKKFSPRIRLLFQATLIILMIFFLDLKINKTNIFYLDIYINNNFFNLIFTSFCILVLLNGSNFCDGINCNVIGYYLIICLAILYSGLPTPNFLTIEIIIFIYIIFYIFNLFKKCFLGDNGVYVISIFMSIYIIKFTNLNTNLSSLIALNLLWYPAFENLFSIIRRIVTKKKIEVADRSHLHTLIFKKILKNSNINLSNSLSGIFINIFMSIGIFASIIFQNSSKILMLILFINIIIYITGYLFLKQRMGKSKSQ
jgi:UDP-N-acetylmuramyl pentapeptide phosphotransferase/UDP-N-acetylglucosamine-1-phosphate transferase